MRHLLSVLDVTPHEVHELLKQTADLKQQYMAGYREARFPGYVVAQIFEKPSLRTRVSFETAMVHLGGSGIFMTEKDAGFHGRESIADIAKVLSSFVDVITMRTFSHQLIEEFAHESLCPVINALSDHSHPCQAFTDIFTMQEVFGELEGKQLTYVGDGNNVAVSLAEVCALTGVKFVSSSPANYELSQSFLDQLQEHCPDATLELIQDPIKAVENADIVYTDVWASMGQEAEFEDRKRIFAAYQVNAKLLNKAPRHAKFMHCLPAKRGLEVSDEVMDGDQNISFLQAENRMHLAKGLYAWLLPQSTKHRLSDH
jgi:ornithine carbamoyltransferase